MKKNFRTLFSIIMILALSTTTVWAGSVSSTTQIVPSENGLPSYSYYATCYSHTNPPSSHGCVSITADRTMSGINFGGLAELFNSNGSLLKSSGWQYVSETAHAASITTTPIYKSGTYYARGQMAAYRGSSYVTYPSVKTPFITASSLSPNAQVRKNANGETYGSQLFCETQLDLIQAINEDGTEGYIRSTDLNTKKSAPLKYKIPLYQSDGVTKVGYFTVEGHIETYENQNS